MINMKKAIVLFSALTLFTMVGCGNGEEEATNKEDSPKEEVVTETETDTKETETEVTENKEVYFKDNEVKLNDLKITITETKVIPVGEAGNEYSDKPVFAIWYDTTNLSDKELDPTTAWMAVFEAIQDNDPNMVNSLEVAGHPDDELLDTQLSTIKKDGTLKNAVAYELDDLETPVKLIATQGIAGDKLGEQTYEVK